VTQLFLYFKKAYRQSNLTFLFCQQEARVTELLFFQKKPNKKRETEIDSIYNGSRVSKRQRDKRELLVKKQQEKQAAEALAGKLLFLPV
jgi:hypothetical protein